jgi:hypothetical protein
MRTRLTKLSGALFLASSLWSAPVTFFGLDEGLGEGTPLAAFPNSLAQENAFKSFLFGVGTETFESFAEGTGGPLSLTFPGAGTAELSGGGEIRSVPSGSTNGFGRYGVSPTKFWETLDRGFSITFSKAVAAFGFYGVDVGDFDGNLVIELDNGFKTTLLTAGSPGGSVLFWGIIDKDSPFKTVSFSNTAAGVDAFGFDNMTIGSPTQIVPEPGSYALLGLGLALLGSLRKLSRP